MKNIIPWLLGLASLWVQAALAQTTPIVHFEVSTQTAAPGEQVCLDVTVENFQGITSFQWDMRWNPEVLRFEEVTNFQLPSLSTDNFNLLRTGEGWTRVLWFYIPPASGEPLQKEDGETVFSLCFSVAPDAPTGFSYLAFDDAQQTYEILYDYGGQTYLVLGNFVPGGVQIRSGEGPRLTGEMLPTRTCDAQHGGIELHVAGGTPPYQYLWSGPGDFASGKSRIEGLEDGIYMVTVTDQNGETATGEFKLDLLLSDYQPFHMIEEMKVEGADCPEENGRAEVIVNGDPAAYTYRWNTGDSIRRIDSLGPGDYSVTVTNAEGCSESRTVEVESDFGPSAKSVAGFLSCTSSQALIGVEVETPGDYSYLWDTGDTTAYIIVAEPGFYQVRITDRENGCWTRKIVPAYEREQGLNTAFAIDCYRGQGCVPTARIAVEALDGQAPFTFNWNSGRTAETDGRDFIIVTDLDIHSVTVTDANGCSAVLTDLLPKCLNDTVEPPSQIRSVKTTSAYCGSDNGSIEVEVQWPKDARTIEWSTGARGPLLTGLAPGNYAVTVTDTLGCAQTRSIELRGVDTIPYRVTNGKLNCSDTINVLEQEQPVNSRMTFVPVADETTGLISPSLNRRIRLYPVPVGSQLRIDAGGLSIDRLELFDVNGRLRGRFGPVDRVPVGHLPAGVYLLRVLTPEGAVVKQWVKR